MITEIMLKDAQRSISVTRDVLLEELGVAQKKNRNGDVFKIKATLRQYFGWEEEAQESSVTPEVKEIVEADQYRRLYGLLERDWIPTPFRNNNFRPTKHEIPATLSPLVKRLLLLLDTLKDANISPITDKRVHHVLGDSESDQLVAQQIHLAQTNILLFIDRLITQSEQVGDSDGELYNALLGSNFLNLLLDYLKKQGCNVHAAGILRGSLALIKCTAKAGKQ